MARSQTAWSNSTKNTDSWSVTTRNSTVWGNESNFPASYIYSDASLTYNSPTRPYNYISAVPADQLNNRNPTAWTGATRNTDSWSNESLPQVGYLFDSTAVYDSSYTYDFTMMVSNQSNNKNTGAWVVVV
jgi:hypothetical protein